FVTEVEGAGLLGDYGDDAGRGAFVGAAQVDGCGALARLGDPEGGRAYAYGGWGLGDAGVGWAGARLGVLAYAAVYPGEGGRDALGQGEVEVGDALFAVLSGDRRGEGGEGSCLGVGGACLQLRIEATRVAAFGDFHRGVALRGWASRP